MRDPLLTFHFPGRAPLAFADPVELHVADSVEQVAGVLKAVDRAARGGLWAAGYVGYEAAPAFDPALRVRPGARLPLAWFGIFRAPGSAPAAPGDAADARFSPWLASTTSKAYTGAVHEIREAIGRGVVYQVNYTMRLRADVEGHDHALYERVRHAQGECYGALLRLERHSIVSASPELFFRRTGELVETRPMKGTRPRGRWDEEDDARAAELAASEKDRAENLMIVDLLRNDLGRIARFGSVRVRGLFEVERYPTVLQMTSTIEAEVPRERTLGDVFAALFPCGSVTGAPKVTAMRAIAELEAEPREAYCGAIGFVEPGGDCTFNVAIRTLVLDRATGRATYGVGGGVTWDSTPEGEHAEAWSKAAVLDRDAPGFRLLETMRLEQGRYARLDRHLARLEASARYFGFSVDAAAVRDELERLARESGGGSRRVRLLVDRGGAIEVQSAPLDAAAPGELPVAVAAEPVPSRDPFLCHKTTSRSLYESRAAARPACFDVLLTNEHGELTEFTRGNLVVELDGALWTPPRECGLLAGTLRAELMEAGTIRERVLFVEDLRRATRVWLINSVRGWVPVTAAIGEGR